MSVVTGALIAIVDFIVILLMPIAALIGLDGKLDDARAVARGHKLYAIVSASMWPTLPKDAVVRAEVPDEPERSAQLGVVVVFRVRDSNWIGRVAGLPGDTIQMVGGRLHRNGSAVPRTLVPSRLAPDPLSGRKSREVACYREVLGAAPHEICEADGDDGYGDRTEAFVIPAGHIFFLGDNRDNSNDSRFDTGFIPFANIIGIIRTVRTGSTIVEVDRLPPAGGST